MIRSRKHQTKLSILEEVVDESIEADLTIAW